MRIAFNSLPILFTSSGLTGWKKPSPMQIEIITVMTYPIAMASVIWEIDSWSLAKQSGIYFAIACVIMFPISYFANWMPHSTAGILSYVGIFVAIFLAAWVTQYSVWKRKIKKMNEGIKDNNDMN